MIIWFARLPPIRSDCNINLPTGSVLRIERQDRSVRFGVQDADGGLTVATLMETLRCLAENEICFDAALVWAFSSIAIPIVELGTILERWDETGEPPVLSIVAMELGKDRHVTRGLKSLLGFELAVRFASDANSYNAARDLARLARHAMLSNGLDRNLVYEGVDGSALHLEWSDPQQLAAMVTIILQSDQNGCDLD